jgi:hypothetical protein
MVPHQPAEDIGPADQYLTSTDRDRRAMSAISSQRALLSCAMRVGERVRPGSLSFA